MAGFDIDKTVDYWRSGARYDLGVATALMKARKYPYALFMGHLALEKLLKALVVKRTGSHAPFTHSLLTLAEKAGLELLPGYREKLSEIMEFHLQGRYPDDLSGFYKTCTLQYATTYLKSIRGVYRWLADQLRRS